MREIKFRGKRVDNGEWVYGDLIQYESGEVSIFSKKLSKYGYEATEMYKRDRIIPETVGQYTGLTDKNGFTKIFEGDIIRLDGTIGGNIYEEKEILKDTTNLIIKGVGTSSWATTEQEAIMRGCHYAE